MLPVMHDLSIRGVHADALFASGLQRCDDPGGTAYGLHAVRPRPLTDQVAGSPGTGRRDRAVFLAGSAVL
jgi:hypothetical protein